jgi:hypothetical protein
MLVMIYLSDVGRIPPPLVPLDMVRVVLHVYFTAIVRTALRVDIQRAAAR